MKPYNWLSATALAIVIAFSPMMGRGTSASIQKPTDTNGFNYYKLADVSVSKLPQRVIADIPTIEPIPEPEPTVAAPVSSGCQWYASGDYYLDHIAAFESGDRAHPERGGYTCSTNAGGCFGLLQACPGAPLRAACGGDPTCQIAWFQANKTGGRSWAQIWQHELDYGWW